MHNTRFAAILPRFVERELPRHHGQQRPLTVGDFKLSIRNLRLTEMIDWSSHELDLLEVHAAQFDDSAPLERLAEVPLEDDPAVSAAAVSSICSPSPFAWM